MLQNLYLNPQTTALTGEGVVGQGILWIFFNYFEVQLLITIQHKLYVSYYFLFY